MNGRFLGLRCRERGTRFRLYPQYQKLRGFARPETVYLDAAPGTIGAGPGDARMYVVDAVDKLPYRRPKGRQRGEPPYLGPRWPGVVPGPDGHFDHLVPGTRAFTAAAAFATVHCVLDIWEDYFGRQLPWYFAPKHPRLEIVPRLPNQDNAWSGRGFLELGTEGRRKWYAENFDVVAHETGHLILRHVIGDPPPARKTLAFRGHDEAAADLVAVIASLHFVTTVEHLLTHTRGNLFSPNELSRVGELGRAREVRRAFNYLTMADVQRDRDPDPAVYKYRLSRPFTGGTFDVLVEIYEQGLVQRGAIPAALAAASWKARGRALGRVQREFNRHYRRRRAAFAEALLDARDYVGRLLARTWDKTELRGLSYGRVVRHMLAADTELSGGRYRDVVRGCFAWRGIHP